jgi:hypothetical protein
MLASLTWRGARGRFLLRDEEIADTTTMAMTADDARLHGCVGRRGGTILPA